MNESFRDHPTPLSWDLDTVRAVHALAGFDAAGICLLAETDEPERLVGFARVEVEPDEAGGLAGWIALLGVRQEHRGEGLGRELLRWSIAHARARGAGDVELSVEALNERALGLYRRTGLEPRVEWPHWIMPVAADGSAKAAVMADARGAAGRTIDAGGAPAGRSAGGPGSAERG